VARLDDGRIQCDCARATAAARRPARRCFVRQNVAARCPHHYGALGLLHRPIEKKPLHHFYPGSSILSFAPPAATWPASSARTGTSASRRHGPADGPGQPEEIARAAERSGCKSVAFTYNDPVIFAEYALDTADACHARGIKTVA